MYIEKVPNRNSPPAVLLRESYREGNIVRKRTLANLSSLPDTVIDNLKIVLKGGTAIENLSESFEVIRSLPHGHVVATLGTLRKIDLHNLIAPESLATTLSCRSDDSGKNYRSTFKVSHLSWIKC